MKKSCSRLILSIPGALGFAVLPVNNNVFLKQNTALLARDRSVVSDPDGPTPSFDSTQIEEVNPSEVEGLEEIQSQAELRAKADTLAVPHQPWRRGDTAGCEAPISATWRVEAEVDIKRAAELAGGRVLDVTWFLTSVLVTIDDEVLPPQDFIKTVGPVVEVYDAADPQYFDPDDPDPEDIWDDEDDVLYQRETEEESAERLERENKSYASVSDSDKDPTEPHLPDKAGPGDDLQLFRNVETREDVADLVADEMQELAETGQQPMNMDTIAIDKAAISTLSYAILEALKLREDELRILSRHEVVLSSPNLAKDVLETQSQFNAHRDDHVAVETIDPFDSNRTLKGQLVDRNAMDVLLNIQGRLVTIPQNFVRCVRLPPGQTVEPYDLYEPDMSNSDDLSA